MLMDMFYDTLPHNISSKTRIHFHNFMQDVHKRLHTMKTEHGTDLDAVKYIAADIAEKGSVLCFDEFQCTDVADAMILRGYKTPPSLKVQLSNKVQSTGGSNVSRSSPHYYFESAP